MYKIHKDKALAGAIVTTIIILAGAVAGVLTYKESAMTTDTALDGTYEAYEVLTNDKLDQPYHVPESAYAGAITGSEKQAEKKYIVELKDSAGNTTLHVSVADAIDAVDGIGYTIKLLDSTRSNNLEIPAGVTLDLNGFTLYSNSINALDGSYVKDSSDTIGRLKVPAGNLTLPENNPQMPLNIGDTGYALVTINMTQQKWHTPPAGALYNFVFLPGFGKELKQYVPSNNFTIYAEVVTVGATSGDTTYITELYTYEQICTAYLNNKTFAYRIYDWDAMDKAGVYALKARFYIESPTGVKMVANFLETPITHR